MGRFRERVYWSRPGRRLRAAVVLCLAPLARRRLNRATSHEERVGVVPAIVPGGAHQIPSEITAFLQLVGDAQPRNVLEIGVADGGTNVLLSRCSDSVKRVIGIDTELRWPRLLRALRPRAVELHLLEGSSRDGRVMEEVARRLGGEELDLVLIDGDHSFDGAMTDYKNFRPLVRRGGLIAFHDIVPDSIARGRPSAGKCAGDVPVVWAQLKQAEANVFEFIDDPEQDGCGIGVIKVD